MQEFGIFWPSLDGGFTNIFRLHQTAGLKITQQKSAVYVFAIRSDLPRLFENARRAIEIPA